MASLTTDPAVQKTFVVPSTVCAGQGAPKKPRTSSSASSGSALTKDKYPELKLSHYEFSKQTPCDRTSGAGLLYIKRESLRLLTTEEDRAPIHQGPLKDPEQSLTFKGVNLDNAFGEENTAEAERLFDILNQYRYKMCLLREADRNPDETARLVKLLREELQQKLATQQSRTVDFYLGRHGKDRKTNQPAISWMPVFIVFDDETMPDNEARAARESVGGVYTAKAFKFGKLPEGIDKNEIGGEFWKEDKGKYEFKSPYTEANINLDDEGNVSDSHFHELDFVKQYLHDYLETVNAAREARAEEIINANGKRGPVTFSGFELSRWGNEGLLDNWDEIMKLIRNKV